MRIDNLEPDTEVVLTLQKDNTDIIATFISMAGEKEDRVAMFVSPDKNTNELFRWHALRKKGRWVVSQGEQQPLTLKHIIRTPGFENLHHTLILPQTEFQYGVQQRRHEFVHWYESEELARQRAKKLKGMVVKRTVTYGPVILDN